MKLPEFKSLAPESFQCTTGGVAIDSLEVVADRSKLAIGTGLNNRSLHRKETAQHHIVSFRQLLIVLNRSEREIHIRFVRLFATDQIIRGMHFYSARLEPVPEMEIGDEVSIKI